ncbi:50S ribosomal protein L10 [Candidatus Dependentiae bacterium]|nr:MAG: 50S ribosomal protein L10 [Candidatus Dependentiae bacterium]
MNRHQKGLVVNQLRDDFTESKSLFLVNFCGMSVEQMQLLRRRLDEKGGALKVSKIRLMKRAAKGIEKIESLIPYLKGQLAFVLSTTGESPVIAKVLYDFAQENKQLHVIAGYLDSELLTKEAVSRIATLPPKEILIAQLCGMLRMPSARLIYTLRAPMIRIIRILRMIGELKK